MAPKNAGGVRWTMWALGASVHPAGILVRPRFMRPFAIPSSEVRAVRFGRTLLRMPTIEVDHAGVDLATPFVLYGEPESDQAEALLAMLARRDAAAAGDSTVAGTPAPAPAAAPPSSRRPPAVLAVLNAFGILAGAGFVAYGILVVIPQSGQFGVAWTVFLVVILATNAARFARRR